MTTASTPSSVASLGDESQQWSLTYLRPFDDGEASFKRQTGRCQQLKQPLRWLTRIAGNKTEIQQPRWGRKPSTEDQFAVITVT